MKIEIKDKREMSVFAKYIGSKLKVGDKILLNGDLGAGKTYFTSCLAAELGISEAVTSPTFTIVKEYKGKYDLFHIDAYRLEGSNEDLSYLNEFYSNGITVIEWPEYVSDYLPYSFMQIEITITGEESRDLHLSFVNCEELELKVKEDEEYISNRY